MKKMKKIEIQASAFFELLKLKDTSMWTIFSQMIDGDEKEIIFLNADNTLLFTYLLPTSLEKLEQDRKQFSLAFSKKIAELN